MMNMLFILSTSVHTCTVYVPSISICVCLCPIASFTGLSHFQLHEESGGPGIFSHMRGLKGGKVVERT